MQPITTIPSHPLPPSLPPRRHCSIILCLQTKQYAKIFFAYEPSLCRQAAMKRSLHNTAGFFGGSLLESNSIIHLFHFRLPQVVSVPMPRPKATRFLPACCGHQTRDREIDILLQTKPRTFEKKTHILAAARCCMRVSLPLLLVWLGTGTGCASFVGRCAVCVWVVCGIHIRALSTPAKHGRIAYIVGPLQSGLIAEVEIPEREPETVSFGSRARELNPNGKLDGPVILQLF